MSSQRVIADFKKNDNKCDKISREEFDSLVRELVSLRNNYNNTNKMLAAILKKESQCYDDDIIKNLLEKVNSVAKNNEINRLRIDFFEKNISKLFFSYIDDEDIDDDFVRKINANRFH